MTHTLQDGRIANIECAIQGCSTRCLGIPAKLLKIGDKMMWNGGGYTTVEAIEFSKTGKTMVVQERSHSNGKLYSRKFGNIESRGVVIIENGTYAYVK